MHRPVRRRRLSRAVRRGSHRHHRRAVAVLRRRIRRRPAGEAGRHPPLRRRDYGEGAGMTDSVIEWKAPSTAPHPARDASIASYEAVSRKDKDAWLALFADDGWIEDPVGPSVFDK